MRSFTYYLARALRGLVSRPLNLVLTLGSIALAFVLLGTVFLTAQNLSAQTARWGSGATVAVDLQHRVASADAARIRQAIVETPGVKEVRLVKPAEAKRRLLRNLGPEAKVVADVEESFLPTSFEVTLAGSRRDVLAAQHKLSRMEGIVPGVEAVRTVQSWFHRLGKLITGLRLAGAGLGLLVLLACGYIIMVTIRLRFVDRSGELEVMRLMGATERFVKTPFLLEGVLQGLLGALLAMGLLFGLYSLLITRSERILGGALRASELGFLPNVQIAYGLAIGALCGLVGALLATRKGANA